MALGSATLSRNATSAWGPIFIPTDRLATWASAPPDVVQDYDGQAINPPGGAQPRYTIANPIAGMQHPYTAPRMRLDYEDIVTCAWGPTHAGNPSHDPLSPPYDSALNGSHIDVYTAPFSSPLDWWASMAFIETETRQGLCYFTTMTVPIPGYPSPVHQWYGTKACPHGYEDKRHDPTTAGEGTTSKMNALHVFDGNDLADIITGVKTATEVRGVMHNLYPDPLALSDFEDAAANDLFIGAFFDPVTNRLYLREQWGDSRGQAYWGAGDNDPKSAIHVFQVA